MRRLLAAGWLLLCARLLAEAQPFSLRLGASGALDIPLAGALADVLVLGQQTDALAGYDVHDVPAPPPPPGQGVPWLCFITPDPLTSHCWHDLRPVAAAQAWQLTLAGVSPGNSVTLHWRLESGTLGQAPLRLLDGQTGEVLVTDMLATTSIALAEGDQSLWVAYGAGNLPPAPRADAAFMLSADDDLALAFADLLANDRDPDRDEGLSVVAAGLPERLRNTPVKAGTSPYGTSHYDVALERIVYTPPSPFPADWTGAVALTYTARDNSPLGALEGTGTVVVTAAPDIVQDPLSARLQAAAGTSARLVYTLRHHGNLQSLEIEFPLPLVGAGSGLAFWRFLGGYADDATETADPAVDAGLGPDGLPATADDTGLLRLDFGTTVPASGTRLHFDVQVPAEATHEERVTALARYRLADGSEVEQTQVLAEVTIVKPRYALVFLAGPGGTLVGRAAQTITHGAAATPIEAVPDYGYVFSHWSDGATANPRILTNVQAGATLTAQFVAAGPADPHGPFTLLFDHPTNPDGLRLWDFTGHYVTLLGPYEVTLDVLHGERGTLTGSGTLAGAMPGGTLVTLPLTIRGKVTGRVGAVTVAINLSGRNATSSAKAKLTMTLGVTGLAGAYSVRLSDTTGGKDSPSGACAMDLPPDMDGTVLMPINLALDPNGTVTGTGLLTLANGRAVDLLLRGRKGSGNTLLRALGNRGEDPAFGAVTLTLNVVTLTNATATVNSLTGVAFGQFPSWP
jgi:hypothetical protein